MKRIILIGLTVILLSIMILLDPLKPLYKPWIGLLLKQLHLRRAQMLRIGYSIFLIYINHYMTRPLVVGILPIEKQTKEAARRDGGAAAWLLYGHMFLLCALGHMFLLCGARPYVSIGWLWAWGSAICFYWLAVGLGLGHMFVLVGFGRGARPYVSIVCVYVYMCVCVCVYVCVCICVCVCVYVCV